jgi:VWFA-related protein
MPAGIYSWRVGMLFACLMGGAALCAQQPAGIQSENGVYTLHEDSHLVLLDVTVTDKQGHPVTGLTKDDFKLTEDGQPQTIKFFEEHAPVDAVETARRKAAAIAGQPLNTFTNYEPLTGRPVAVLLLNRLFPIPPMGWPHQQMLDLVQNSPPDTPFAVYLLDSELRLVQPVTTNRALLAAKIDEMWKSPYIDFELISSRKGRPVEADVPVRRKTMTTGMQQLAAGLKDTPGRKDLLAFTGNFQCSVVGGGMCPHFAAGFGDGKEFLCGLMDTLEQGRIWIYRYYGDGTINYGFGCGSTGADTRDLFATDSHYYTLYYAPTNGDWNGEYRATTVDVADGKGLRLAYRKGYFGTPENVEGHYYTANAPAAAPVPPKSGGAAIAATTVTAGVAGSRSIGAAEVAPNPAALVFSVEVVPADASAAAKEKQQNRPLTLLFTMPSSEFKVAQSDAGRYVTRLEIGAESHADGKSLETYESQMAVNFDGASDPRIANSMITAKLTLNIPEHGHNRWLEVSVRDVATGQFGSLVIPMGQVKMPTQ